MTIAVAGGRRRFRLARCLTLIAFVLGWIPWASLPPAAASERDALDRDRTAQTEFEDPLALADIVADGPGPSVASTSGTTIDLSLTKTVDVSLPIYGARVVFTLTVSNAAGQADATGVSVLDWPGTGYQYFEDDSATTGTTYNPFSGVWNVGNVAAGTSVRLKLTFYVLGAGNHENEAQVWTANETDVDSTPGNGTTNSEDDTDSASTTPGLTVPACNVAATQDTWLDEAAPTTKWGSDNKLDVRSVAGGDKRALIGFDLSSVPAGSIVTRATLWLWQGTRDDTGLPINIHRVNKSWNESSAQWNNANGDFDPAVRGSFTPDVDSNNVFVSADIDSLVQEWIDGTFDDDGLMLRATSNNDTSKYDSIENGTATQRPCLEVQFIPPGSVDLSLTKTVDDATPVVGSAVEFTVTVTNAAVPTTATGVQVKDLLPSGYVYVSDDSASTSTSYDDSTGIWDVGNVAPSTSIALKITATVQASGDYTNTAEITAIDQPDSDSIPNNNIGQSEDDEDVASTTPIPLTDLWITKDDGATMYTPGSLAIYSIVVGNAGPTDVTGASVSDLVTGLSQVSTASWTCTATGGASCALGTNAGDINDTVNLPVGDTVTYSLVVSLQPGAMGNLANTASVTAPTTVSDSDLTNNSATDTNTAGPTGGIDPSPLPNIVPIPAGSLVIPMDNAKQTLGADPWNLKAYGLAVHLLWNEIPLRWAIRAGKPKDGVDFTAEARQLQPSVGPTGTLEFRAGPLIIPVQYVTTALPLITAFGGDVAVYELTEDTNVDVRYTLSHKPKAAILDDGLRASIHGDIFAAAGLSAGLHYDVIPATNLGTVNSSTCYTMASEPHYKLTDSGVNPDPASAVEAVRTFVQSGANFLAQCAAITTYENDAGNGFFQTTNGIAEANVVDANFDYRTPDLPFLQFEDELRDANGTITDFVLNGGGFQNGGHVHVSTAGSGELVASVSRLGPEPGTNVFYLGSHNYFKPDGASSGPPGLNEYNGVRMYLNALLTPAVRPPACGLNFVVTGVDLAVTKSDGVTSAPAGSSLTYTIAVTNNGPDATVGADVADVFDTAIFDVGSVSWSCSTSGSGSCADAGPTTGDIATTVDLGVGETATFVVTAPTLATATGTVSNTATATPPTGISDPNPGNNSATDDDTELQATDLSVTKDDGATSYTPGGSVAYTIVVSNAGPSPVTGATVSDEVTSIPQVASASWTCVAAGGAVCAAGPVAGDIADTVNLPVGGTATYTLNVTTRSDATGPLSNSVTVSPPASTAELDADDNTASDVDSQGPSVADLSLTIDDGVTSFTPGEVLTYTIVVNNNGPGDIAGATVSNPVTGLAEVSGADWTCVAAGGASCTAGPIVGDISDTIGLPVGGTATYTVNVTTRPDATTDLVNPATVAVPAGASDPTPADNSVSDTDTAGAPVADLQVTKDDGLTSYTPGAALDYTIVVSNAGPSDVSSASVIDNVTSLPEVAGAVWSCVAAGGAGCTAGPVVGNINDTADLPVGGTATYTLSVTTFADASTDLVNSAEVTVPAGASDPDGTNNSASDTDTAGPLVANLAITKDDGSGSYTPGGSLIYSIVVSNAGPSDVSGATVSDAVTGLSQVASASWTCVAAGGASCTAGPVAGDIADSVGLPVGGTATYTLNVAIKSGAMGDLISTAGVAVPAGASDPDTLDNSATDTDTQGDSVTDLAISIDDGSTTYTPGGSVTYTVVVSNAGPSDVTGATVSDEVTDLPQVASASWTCIAAGGATCTAGPVSGDITDSVDLPVGGTATYTLGVVTRSDATGSLVNPVSVATPAGSDDPNLTDNADSDTDTRAPVSDLSVSIDDGMTSYTPGATPAYTIVVGNAGPSDVIGATVSAPVIMLAQVAGATWSCAAAGGATCTAGPVAGDLSDTVNLPVGSTATYTFNVTTRSNAGGELVNTVGVAVPAGTNDPIGTNDSATDSDSAGPPVSNLGIVKDDASASYTPGGDLTYTIVVSNAGPSDVTGVTVDDPVTALTSVTSAVWSCAAAGGASCTAGPVAGDIADSADLPVGGTATYTLSVTIDSGATGPFANTATVAVPAGASDPDTTDNSDTDTDTQGSLVADLAITKDDGSTSYTPGSGSSYNLVATNAGPSDVTGATITDLVTALPQVASAGWTCTSAGGASCTAGPVVGDITDSADLPVGGTVTYTLNVVTRSDAAGPLVNTAAVSTPAGVSDPDSTDNNASDSDSRAPVADLSVTIDDGASSYTPGGTPTYTIVVSNAGPSDVTGATVSADVLALPEVTGATWSCAAAGGAGCTTGPVDGDLADTINLPVGGTATYTMSVTTRSDAAGNLVNNVDVAVPAGATDPVAGNDSASDTDTAGPPVADLAISIDDGVGSYTPGGALTYTIVVSNDGPSDVTGASVSDPVTALTEVTSADWTCVASAGASCTAGPVVGDIADSVNLPVGGTATYTLHLTTEPSATTDLANMVSVAAPAGASDPDLLNNSDTDTDTVGSPVADLAITKDDGAASYTPGAALSYTIVVSNAGPSDVTGATVSDPVTALPQVAGASWTCVAAGGATCTAGPSAGDIADTITLPVGGTATYTLVATTASNASGPLANTATVAVPAGATDPEPANDSDTDSDSPGSSVADLAISVDDGTASYTPGGSLTYTIVLSNNGPGDVIGATVSDPVTSLPQVAGAGWTCVGAGGASCTAGPVIGDIVDTVDLPVGGTATYTLSVTTRSSATGDLVNAASVAVPAGTSDPVAINNRASDTDIAGRPVADLAITMNDGTTSYFPGDDVTYTIVASNAGPSDITGAVVSDAATSAPEVAGASWTCVGAGGVSCTTGPVAGDISDLVDLPVGGTATYTLLVTTNPSATSDLVQSADVTAPAVAFDPQLLNNGVTDSNIAADAADLFITNDDGAGTYTPGDSVSYTIVVGNAGPRDVTGAAVENLATSLPQVVGATWSCVAAGGATCTAGPTVGDLVDSVDLPSGSTATYTLVVTIDPSAMGDLVSTATVTEPAGVLDPNLADNTAIDTDTQGASAADLSITNDDGVSTYTPGGTLTYTLVGTNAGPSAVTGASVTHAVTALPQITGASWTCVAAGGASCTAGPQSGDIADTVDLPVGGTVTYSVDVTIDSAASTDLTTTAGIAVPGGANDPLPANNSASDTDSPAPQADLWLTKTAGSPSATIGSPVVFTLTVTNDGPSNATAVQVLDQLPAAFDYVSHSGPGSYDAVTGVWSIGTVTPSTPAELTIATTLNASSDNLNHAEVLFANEPDPDSIPGNGNLNGEDDEATRGVVAAGAETIVLSKAANKPELTIGEGVEYTIEIRNTSPIALTDVTIEDQPPVGFKYVPGSARLDGAPIAEPTGGRPLRFAVGTIPGLSDTNGNGVADADESGYRLLSYQLRASSGAVPGVHRNTAVAISPCCTLSSPAQASVEVTLDAVLDLGLIIGKVFHDRNENGRQDAGEIGIPDAMVALDNATYALTDGHGRYHLPALKPGQRMLKVNRHSLPPGARMREPFRVLRITPGLMATADFAVVYRLEAVSVGTPPIPGVAVTADETRPPLVVSGNADTLSVYVNGQRVMFNSGDVRLGLKSLDPLLTLRAEQLDQPIRFSFRTVDSDRIESWTVTVQDGAGLEVRRFTGVGPPPPTLEWNGRDESDAMALSPEVYEYFMTARWTDGTESKSPVRSFGVEHGQVISMRLTGEAFESGGHELSEKARQILTQAARTLREFPKERILIEGHTDSVGSEQSNLGLSRRRAQAALTYLVGVEKLPAERFTIRALGESRPVGSNAVEEGRTLNRRIEIKGEFDHVERTPIVDAHRSPAFVKIDGEPADLGTLQEFDHPVERPDLLQLKVEASDAQGRLARTTIPVPRLEIREPLGAFIVGPDLPARGCRYRSEPTADTDAVLVCRVEGQTDPGNTVEHDGKVVRLDVDGRFAFELDLSVGAKVGNILARNPEGFSRVASLAIQVSDRGADGHRVFIDPGVPGLTVNLPQDGSKLASSTLPISGRAEPGNRVEVNGLEFALAGDGTFHGVVELPAGPSRLVIEVIDPKGTRGRIERDVDVARTQLFLLAFADGKLGQLSGDGAIENSGLDEDGDLIAEGRVAFYLKGRIRGKYLITAAFDSGEDSAEHLFSNVDSEGHERLLSNLDPDRYYPIYGDSSTVVYDAETDGKLYLALESDTLSALVGNYPIALTDTELASYQRTLYGARVHYVSASKGHDGRAETEVVVFANEVRRKHVRDELNATGGSLYYLSNRDVVEGSEQVTLIVRDKLTQLTLSREVQRQNVDYTIKYPEGRLMFHRPLSSVTGGGSLIEGQVLPGHPVFVQVDYETRLAHLDKTGFGTRARRELGDHLTVGGTYVQDESETGEYTLTGLDAEVRLGQNTRLVAEHATSDGSDAVMFRSHDGGITYNAVPLATGSGNTAMKLAAEVDVGEWLGAPDRYRVGAYIKELDPGFSSSGNATERGTRKVGVNASLELTDSDSVRVRHDREEFTGTLATASTQESDTTSVQWERVKDRWGVALEYLDTERRATSGATLQDSSFAATRVWWKPSGKLGTRLTHQQTINGGANDQTTIGATYQALPWLALEADATHGTLGESARAGAVYARNGSEIYLSQSLSSAQARRSQTTVVGVRSPLGASSKVYSEYQWEETDAGGQALSLVGVQRQWDAGKGLRILLGGETANVNSSTAQSRRSAINSSVFFTIPERLSANVRNAIRYDDLDTDRVQFVSDSHFDYTLNDDLSMLAGYRYSKTEDRGTGNAEARLEERTAGLAYRPVRHDRFNSIFRYTQLFDQRPGQSGSSGRRELEVVSLDTSYRFHPRIEWLAKGALRRIDERAGQGPTQHTSQQLLLQRLNYEVLRPINLSAEYRILRESTLDDRQQGWLLEVGWRLHENFRIGAGFNFTDFSDDMYSVNDYSASGWFLRAQGMY